MNALPALIAALLLSGCGSSAAPPPFREPQAAARPAPLPGDSLYQLPLPIVDQDGRTWDWRTRRGRPQVVSMFYTSCRYVCPLIVDSGKALEKALTPAERDRIDLLLISLDPRNDTPAALHAIVDKRRLDTQRWTLAAPRHEDVRSVAGVLGIRYRELDDGGFNHSTALVLLDREGRIAARTEKVGTSLEPEFVAQVRRLATR
jgi:protein SCO1/2